MIWEGQEKLSAYDNTVKKGTHVFWRDKGQIPYTYKGIVIKRTLLKKRTKKHPIKLKLIIDDKECQFEANTICNNINNDELYKYQNAC